MSYLKIYKGPAARPIENTTFREISSRLKLLFRAEKIPGILLGTPICKQDKSLSVDILILTRYSILILELKNFGNGTLRLPQPQHFDDGYWFIRENGNQEEVPVKGGSANSPFRQLGFQRAHLIKQLETLDLQNFSPSLVKTGVIFQKPIEFNGYVPDRFANSFFICDITDYLDLIYDFINIKDDKAFLSEFELAKIFRLFHAHPYNNTLVCQHKSLRPQTIPERFKNFFIKSRK